MITLIFRQHLHFPVWGVQGWSGGTLGIKITAAFREAGAKLLFFSGQSLRDHDESEQTRQGYKKCLDLSP